MYNSLLLTALLLKYLGKQLNVVLPMAYSKLYRESGPNFVGARTIGCSIQSFFKISDRIPGISNRNIWSNEKRPCSLWSLDRVNMCFCVVEFQASVSLLNSPFQCNVI